MKAYRLVNSKELMYLEQRFEPILAEWNAVYASKEIKLKLSCATKQEESPLALINQAEKPVALVDKNYLSSIKEAVFSDSAACFDLICEDLFKHLLQQLLALDSVELATNTTSHSEWFYQGSPCLILRLGRFNLYLHPNWVLANLPKADKPAKHLVRLEEALANKELQLTVELEPLVLSVAKLSGLQVGDIVKTSHPHNKPLLLNFQQQAICEVELGQQLLHRSIQLRKSL
ncbi:Flagellar motor switch protein [Legionella massiliensis]|uniref:Flagellar motor switch protein n=1 Tax=Legionella massiliensis TaxID=1034943 RepID=A0A078KZ97_9GAMM|nr:FliM/FliN family flagellar motor switch protein [Legionella massiliensis]CDZ77053.1 Flagellar motor switch protein [Legionella massiliensis]CEE12791.1 Surface presentation of antigens (SPOA) [Legionella massiliensis]